jgi:GNAT superfamily N-acetyltransferase
MDQDSWVELLGGDFLRLIGPAFQGCLDPREFRPASSEKVRFVEAEDRAAVNQFRAASGPDEWKSGGLDEVTAHMAAHFDGSKITAMAGYRRWRDDTGDPCVLTHPEFRGRGDGTAVVSAVVGRAMEEGKLLLYQTLESNRRAVGIALRLGYRQYASHVAVRLKAETRSNAAV